MKYAKFRWQLYYPPVLCLGAAVVPRDGAAGPARLLVHHLHARPRPHPPHRRLPDLQPRHQVGWDWWRAVAVLASDWCRFSLDFQHPNNYRLRVSGVRLGDRGYYHCQLATHPPQLVWTYLDIVTPSFRKSEIISLMLLKMYLSTSAPSLSESVALSTKQLIVS